MEMQETTSSRGEAGGRATSATEVSGRTQRSTNGNGRSRASRLAGGLGWFSLGLGLAQVLAPGEVARMVGVRNDRRIRGTMTALGVRELANGLGILAANRRGRWLWLRVGGDLVDLGLLGSMMSSRRRREGRMTAAFTALTALTMLDALAARRASRGTHGATKGADAIRAALPTRQRTVTATATIRRSLDEVYRFWREPRNLSRFLAHVESVEEIDDRRWHWKVRGPAGVSVEWDAEIVEDREGELIRWRSLPGADIDNHGTVRFVHAPGNRGTEIHAEITYAAPGGKVGAMIAKLFGREPGQQARGDLRRLKQVLETGEIVHSDASIHGMPHAAQPPTRRFLAQHGFESHRGFGQSEPERIESEQLESQYGSTFGSQGEAIR